ncbi:MAG: helix-turn-helix domain-containing protein [Kibdelosporangium sp.]
MTVQRTRYYCPVELAIDVIGGKWAVIILAHLKDRPLRYGELRRRMPDVTEKMLAQRLRELADAGLVHRSSPEPPAVEYRLTEEAGELRPALQALYDWGERRAARTGIPIEPVT